VVALISLKVTVGFQPTLRLATLTSSYSSSICSSESLGLVDQEVDEGDAQEAAAELDEEDLGLQVRVPRSIVHQVGCRVGDGPVKESVDCGCHGESLGANFEWEDLAGDDPGNGAPSGGEKEDEDADECDASFLCPFVVDDYVPLAVLAGCCGIENSYNELGDAHADGTPEEEGTATPLVDSVEAGERRRSVYAAGSHADNKGILNA
jgi:hypothetical protein